MPKVSIIIPCYNQARYLAEAISSALAQDYADKEVIVVNDGSEDNTRDVAGSFGNSIVVLQQENRGRSAARNSGIRIASGDYIATLDSDDLYLPGFLSNQVSFLEAHPDIAMVCSDAWILREDNVKDRWSDYMGRPGNPDNFRWELFCPPSCSVMLRRACFDLCGLFDETLKTSEDLEMWIRIGLHFNMSYIDRPLVLHRRHRDNSTNKLRQRNAGVRQTVAKVVSGPCFIQYPPHFRAKLLFFRFATTWRVEPKVEAIRYFFRALRTDPRQLPCGLGVVLKGVTNTAKRTMVRLLQHGGFRSKQRAETRY